MTSPENEIKDISSAAVMWWLTILLGFISPLIFFLTKKDDAYVQANCKESLNIQLNLTFLYFISIPLTFILIGMLIWPVVFICHFVFTIQGALAAADGRDYQAPLIIRLVK